MGVLDDIREQYPTLAFLLNNPEVGPLLRKAVDPNSTYSPGRFQAELMQTGWWKRSSQSAREYEILSHTDPGTFKQNINTYKTAVRQRARQMGVALTDKEVVWLANSMLRLGQQPDGPELGAGLVKIRKYGASRQREGSIRTYARGAQGRAQSAYMLRMSTGSAERWGNWMALGEKSQDDLEQYLRRQAAAKYPWLAKSINGGQTMADLFSEHVSTIAETLELDPNSINLTDSKWSKVLNYRDRYTGERRSMTTGEAGYLARQDTRFWRTAAGREADAQGANMILNMFGKRA